MDFKPPQNQEPAIPPKNPQSQQGPQQRPRLNLQNVSISPPKSHFGAIAAVVIIVLVIAGVYTYMFQPSLFDYLLSSLQSFGNQQKLQTFSGIRYGFNYLSGWHVVARPVNGTGLLLNGEQNVTATLSNGTTTMPSLFISITTMPYFLNTSDVPILPFLLYNANLTSVSRSTASISGVTAFEDSVYNVTALPRPSFIKSVAFSYNNVTYLIFLTASGSQNINAGNAQLNEVLGSFNIK